MPSTRIELSKPWSKESKVKLAEFVHQSLVKTLGIPPQDKLIRIIEFEKENFLTPSGSENYVHIEISMFPGRSVDAKRQLYKSLCKGMRNFGVEPTDARIVIHEIAPENWGIRGGLAGCDI